MEKRSTSEGFGVLLQNFFGHYLLNQRSVSTRTVAAYRDTFRLLLLFGESHLNLKPSAVTLTDLNATNILAFLDYLEAERQNCIRSRNARLAAIKSFLRYAALRDPASLSVIQQALAIPLKRSERPLLGFLSRPEMEAILEAPSLETWSGRRDRVMLTTFYNTGARVSEIIRLCVSDINLEQSPNVTLHGKGRKQRVLPLWKKTARLIKQWVNQNRFPPDRPLFPNTAGRRLTRSGIANRLKEATQTAAKCLPSLKKRQVTPHTIRHTTAMHLLQSGVDLTVIALWLGHEKPSTTHMYMEADVAMKRKALGKIPQAITKDLQFRPKDQLLRFLETL